MAAEMRIVVLKIGIGSNSWFAHIVLKIPRKPESCR